MFSRVRTFALLAIALLPLSGCLFRSHKVTKAVFVGQLKHATVQELIQKVNEDAAKLKTLQLTVDIDSQSVKDLETSGTTNKSKVTDYQEVRGYILLRKPGNLRMQGLVPVVHNTMFDMVSDGERFRLSVPPKNKFVVGGQEVKIRSKNPGENMRPRQIYDALIVEMVDPKTDLAVLETGTVVVQDAHHHDVLEPNYIMTIIHNGHDAPAFIERKIYFSREDLSIQKQVLFDREGNASTVGTYNNYTTDPATGILYPHLIKIERPQEQYNMQLGVVAAKINIPMTDEQDLSPVRQRYKAQV